MIRRLFALAATAAAGIAVTLSAHAATASACGVPCQ